MKMILCSADIAEICMIDTARVADPYKYSADPDPAFQANPNPDPTTQGIPRPVSKFPTPLFYILKVQTVHLDPDPGTP